MMSTTLYYVHDPMCSWCYAFRQSYLYLKQNLPNGIQLKRLLGGLAGDTEKEMPEAMRQRIQSNWIKIQETVPGVEFNFDYWRVCRPRRATYLACRAVIAARQQGQEYDEIMTHGIQQVYYTNARNPSNLDTLVEIAAETGLDSSQFAEAIQSRETDDQLKQEIQLSRQLGIVSFPSLLVEKNNKRVLVPHSYTHPEQMILSLNQIIIRGPE